MPPQGGFIASKVSTDMATEHTIRATARNDEGKGASRRLRRTAQIPAIVYGGSAAPKSIQLEHEKTWIASQSEWFYSSILSLDVTARSSACCCVTCSAIRSSSRSCTWTSSA